MRVIPRLIQN